MDVQPGTHPKSHPAGAGLEGLDPVLTSPKRLVAMAVLSRSSTADFSFLRAHLQVSDSDLSKQMSALQAASYVEATKSGRGRGGATTYRITATGRAAYEQHRAVLRAIVE